MSDKNIVSNHMDKMVVYFFVGMFLISASVFGYRYYGYTPCKVVPFEVKAKEFRVGEVIKFYDKTKGASSWVWKFGDSELSFHQSEAMHVYRKAGQYKVSLLVNDNCEQSEVITVKEKLVTIDSTKFSKFKIPKSIIVGDTLVVKDVTPHATTWEWRFGETATVNAKTKEASYIYKKPGLKTISLIVNGDLKYITSKKINVVRKETAPVEEEEIREEEMDVSFGIKNAPTQSDEPEDDEGGIVVPEKPTVVPFINEADFKNKIMLVSQEKMSPKEFTQYFCGDLDMSMISNGEKDTFLVFCEKIKGKTIRIRSLVLYRNEGSNCITNFAVNYKKTGLSILK